VADYALKLSEAELERYRWMAESAEAAERDLWVTAGVAEGAAVADIGCGPGAISVVIAGRVGPSGRVVAVERSPEVAEVARAAASRAGLDNVTVTVGDAQDTGIAPGSVDLAMIRHVLAHNGGREEAIVAHAATLPRPGGCVYLVDVDLSATRSRPPDTDLADLEDRYRQWHEQQGNDLSVGLRLAELLTAAGLETVDYQGRYQIVSAPPGFRPPSWAARDSLVAAGLAIAADVGRWSAAFDRLDATPERPVIFVPLFFAVGRRPAG